MNQPPKIILDQQSWDKINEINTDVNTTVKYKSDLALYQQPDFWTIAESEGDCDDYVLTKRKRLHEAGVAKDVMRIATCWTENGEYHAVLLLETNAGTLVLDNRFNNILHFQELMYSWHLIQTTYSNKTIWREFR